MIGAGNFAFTTIAYYLTKVNGPVLHSVMDRNLDRAQRLARFYGAPIATDDASSLLEDPAIALIYIASNHASHAEYAIQALNRNKNVHIEKPHVVSQDQLTRLCDAMNVSLGKVTLGFNRPKSRLGSVVLDTLAHQSGPSVLNWFIAGHAIPPDHWYFKEEEGGRVLGNLCHWTDFIYHCVPASMVFPVQITPTRADRSDCDIAVAYTFADDTVAALTFSAKGHAFEGVKERFAAHRGDALITLDDFHRAVITIGPYRKTHRSLFRDHGHATTIQLSYRTTFEDLPGADIAYVRSTGKLFLATKEALDSNTSLVLSSD